MSSGYLVWVNTGAYGWHPIPCASWSMAVLCYQTLIRFGCPGYAILVTEQRRISKDAHA